MLVDDEPSVINALKRIISLQAEYFSAEAWAYSANEAMRTIPGILPDILFTDIKMPGVSGIDLIKWVSEYHPEIVVVVISGYDDFSYVHDAFMYGVEDYILKPVAPDKLLLLLDHLRVKLKNHETIKQTTGSVLEQDKSDAGGHTVVRSVSEKMVRDIEEHITTHIQDENSIYDICKLFSISQPYLSRIFRKHKNCTYNEFLISVRIASAKRLLQEQGDLLIGSIAALTGFSNQYYFSKVFKNVTGTTPTEYRSLSEK